MSKYWLLVLAPAYALAQTGAGTSGIAYYVNPNDAGCSDAGDGLARTAGRGREPWCTISRSNGVAHGTAAGHVTVYIEHGSYRNQPIIPNNSGLSATQNIRWCAIGGDAYLLGPSSSSILYAIDIAAARAFITVGGCDSSRIKVDGEVVFGTRGGQVEKGEDPASVARIQRGINVQGDDITIDVDHMRTAGWSGIDLGASAARPILRFNGLQHGTPYYTDGNDFGDTIWVDQAMAGTNPVLIDGGSTGRAHYLGGHASGVYYGGRVLLRGISFKGSWGAISTFGNTFPDGNRGGFVIGRNATDSHAHDVVFNGSGRSQDQVWTECYKTEGTRTTLSNFWVRNCLGYANNEASAEWSSHARGTRHAHGVFENIGGPIGYIQDWDGGEQGDSELNDIAYKNIIVKDYATQPRCCGSSAWPELFVFQLTGSQTLESIGFRVDGMTIENATGSCADVDVTVYGGRNPGTRDLGAWEKIYPDVFDDITCTKDVNLDSLPPASTDVTVDDMAAYLALAPEDTLSRRKGVDLTVAINSGTRSTNLCVSDITWFPRRAFNGDVPGIGQWAGAYRIHMEGIGNVTVSNAALTDEAGTDGCFTLSAAQTWTDGIAVNYDISDGGTPNRGYVR